MNKPPGTNTIITSPRAWRRLHQSARHTRRLRHALREYFPAALEAFEDLDAADTLELLAKAPDPAARLTITQITATLSRARRRNIAEKATRIQTVPRAEHLGSAHSGHRGLCGHHPRRRSGEAGRTALLRQAATVGELADHPHRHTATPS